MTLKDIPSWLEQTPTSTVSPPVETLKQELPFHELHWKNFERLCLRLINQEANIKHCQMYGDEGQKQGGIDLFARSTKSKKYIVYQCKRERNFGPAKIEAVVNKFMKGEWVSKTETLVLCTMECLVSTQCATKIEELNDKLTDLGIELIPWDCHQLSDKLKKSPDIVIDFFGKAWAKIFCTEIALKESPYEVPSNETLAPFHGDNQLCEPVDRNSTGNFSKKHKALVQLSEIAHKDAEWIGGIHNIDGSFDVKLDHRLYVHRDIENDLFNTISHSFNSDLFCILIVGEAGFGKTSLLWKVYSELKDNAAYQIYFLKASYLLKKNLSFNKSESYEKRQIEIEDLEFIAARFETESKQPIFLIDTVDLLLHDEQNRNFFLKLVFTLSSHKCCIIATSRPQEAKYLKPISHQRLELKDYNESELEKAIANHAYRLYYKDKEIDIPYEISRIKNAVSSGMPIREVCSNPLTLRMLFFLYAPDQVPLEINIFQLYVNYWESRVCKDIRAGNPYTEHQGVDISITAGLIALAMTSEGSPDLSYKLLCKLYSARTNFEQELSELISRGILHYSEGGPVRFFHQTLFEHSAARGFIELFDQESIAILRKRLDIRQNDLFITPVMEHTLLLSEFYTKAFKKKADSELLTLLNSDNLQEKISGIYVYTHKTYVSENVYSSVSNLFSSGNSVLIRRYLEIAANVSKNRYKNLFKEICIIWERNDWKEIIPLLELIERLSIPEPSHVFDFLNKYQIIDNIHNLTSSAQDQVIKILNCYVLDRDQKRVEIILLKIYSQLKTVTTEKLITNLFNCITKFIGQRNLLTGFRNYLEELPNSKYFNRSEISPAAGRFLYTAWVHIGYNVQDMVEASSKIVSFQLKWHLYAISYALENTTAENKTTVWHHFKKMSDKRNQWLWAQIVLPQLIDLKEVKDEFVKLLNTSCSKTHKNFKGNSVLLQQIVTAINESHLDKNHIFNVIDISPLYSHDFWISKQLAGRLLVKALCLGHSGAISALERIIKEPECADTIVLNHLCNSWSPEMAKLIKNPEKVLNLFFICKSGQNLPNFLESSFNLGHQMGPHAIEQITTYVSKSINHRSSHVRLCGLNSWIKMMEHAHFNPPELTFIENKLNKEDSIKVKAAYAKLVSTSSNHRLYDFGDVFKIFSPFTQASNQNLRESAAIVLITVLLSNPNVTENQTTKLLSTILTSQTNTNLISRLGYIIEKNIDKNTNCSFLIFESIIVSQYTNSMAKYAKRLLANKIRKPARRLIAILSYEKCEKLLSYVPSCDPIIGRIVIDAVCSNTFEVYLSELDLILEENQTPEDIKNLILWHKHYRERTVGSEGWPDLVDSVHGKKRIWAF